VNAIGVDEHVWSHTGPPGTGMVTGIVDHTRDAHGVVHARLLDLVPGRSRKAYADWLKDRGTEFTTGIKTAALDPFRGYANADRDELPEAITVLDAFHAGELGSALIDEVRRRVQQDTLGHRGRKGDPLHGIRRTLQIGAEHLTDKQAARLDTKLALGDPDREVTLTWQCYQKLRNSYHAPPARGQELVNEVISSFPTCPIPEVARLGRTLKQWKGAILAYFDTSGASNGPTEAINGVIETTRGIARGFRSFTNYRLRCLLAAGGHRPYRKTPSTTPGCEGPLNVLTRRRKGRNQHRPQVFAAFAAWPRLPHSACTVAAETPSRSGSKRSTGLLSRPSSRRLMARGRYSIDHFTPCRSWSSCACV
jgi:transposase